MASPQVWRYRVASQQFSQKNNWPKRQSASHGALNTHTHSELLCAENLRSSQWGSLTNTPLARRGGQQEWGRWERPFSAVVSHLEFYCPSLSRRPGKTQLISIVKTQHNQGLQRKEEDREETRRRQVTKPSVLFWGDTHSEVKAEEIPMKAGLQLVKMYKQHIPDSN